MIEKPILLSKIVMKKPMAYAGIAALMNIRAIREQHIRF